MHERGFMNIRLLCGNEGVLNFHEGNAESGNQKCKWLDFYKHDHLCYYLLSFYPLLTSRGFRNEAKLYDLVTFSSPAIAAHKTSTMSSQS